MAEWTEWWYGISRYVWTYISSIVIFCWSLLQGTLSDGLVYVRNLTLSNEGHLNGVFTTADTESTDKGSLEKRYTWKRNEIQVSYHATGKCHTTADKAKIKNIVEEALYHQSIWKRAAACFTIWYDGTWLGHVKILEMTSGGNVLTEGKEKTCQGKKYVSNTCWVCLTKMWINNVERSESARKSVWRRMQNITSVSTVYSINRRLSYFWEIDVLMSIELIQ